MKLGEWNGDSRENEIKIYPLRLMEWNASFLLHSIQTKLIKIHSSRLPTPDLNSPFDPVNREIGEKKVMCFHGTGLSAGPEISYSDITWYITTQNTTEGWEAELKSWRLPKPEGPPDL